MFDVFYIGNNPTIKEHIPFATQVDEVKQIKPKTKMYWVVEPNIEVLDYDVFNFRPKEYDQKYEHVWKWNPKNYGGIRLLPNKKSQGKKEINDVVCKKSFDIIRTKTPGRYFTRNPYATHVWCVDPEYKLNKQINWAPDNFEPTYIHSFHLRDQLEYKYPEKEGGIKLYPCEWKNAQIKFHGFLDNVVEFPVMFVDDPSDYNQRNIYKDDYVWLVDKEYKINTKTLDWVPNPFEDQMVHVFRMPYQLTEKYPMNMGGIHLVPKKWKDVDLKIHQDCPVEDEAYDVFFVDEDEFNSETYQDCAERSKTDWFWVVDRDFDFNGKLLFVPGTHEEEFIHVFKIPNHMEYRYPPDIIEPWDTRCGGVRLVNKNFDMTKQKYQEDIVPVRYDVFFLDNPKNFDKIIEKSRTKMFWVVDSGYKLNQVFKYVPRREEQKYLLNFKIKDQLLYKYPEKEGGIYLVPKKYTEDTRIKYKQNLDVRKKQYPVLFVDDVTDLTQVTQDCWVVDREYQIDENIEWVPSNFENKSIHTFHMPGQLRHKYPESMGGIRWVPYEWNGEYVIHDDCPFLASKFEVFTDENQGREKSTKDWFWVIDDNVDVHTEFDFDFVPEVWDAGKTHVWQKLNPITKKQYDYCGVMLCAKVPAEKGRPKYIREPACTQHEYPKLFLNNDTDIIEQIKDFESKCKTNMYWLIDPYTLLDVDFDFSYYPTQWDVENVHVFCDQDDNHRNVRLIPTGMITRGEYTINDIQTNSFLKLKKLTQVASLRPTWPVIEFENYDRDKFVEQLQNYKSAGTPFVWTVDPDVDADQNIIEAGFLPELTNTHKVHTWQRQNPNNGSVHSYGGLRLWPTDIDCSKLTTDKIELNKIKDLEYVKQVGCSYKPYDIVFLSYHEPTAEETFEQLSERFELIWVRDVDGIFEAHKEAAQLSQSKMFWVIDADADVMESFDFSYIPDVYDQDVVHVWNSINPVTGQEYGYGGVKLFNRQQVLDATSWGLDFTTGLSTRFKAMPEVSCITQFNTDEFSTWRSAFRESVKLALKDDAESKERLAAWLNPIKDASFSEQAKRGAEEGKQYVEQYRNKPSELNKINDFSWMKNKYAQK